MVVSDPLEAVIEKWRRKGILLLPPIEEAIVLIKLGEGRRNISRDVVNLYCTTGGMREGEMDNLWSLWSLDRVASENSDKGQPIILFADYLIDSHFYGFKYESEEISSVCVEFFNGDAPIRVASSVSEFFHLYLTDRERLKIWDLDRHHSRTG